MSSSTNSSSSILGVVQHYQRNIERCQNDEARLLHCINKLYQLPVKVEHLQETGIGKTVNSLRKFNGEIGVAAKALVTKWKAMVTAEEEPLGSHCQNNEEEAQNSNGIGPNHEDQYDHNQNSAVKHSKTSHNSEMHKSTERHSSKEKSRHKNHENEEYAREKQSGNISGQSSSKDKHTHAEKQIVEEDSARNKQDSSHRHHHHQHRHHSSDKKETEKRHKSRESEYKSEQKKDEKGEHCKREEKPSSRKTEKRRHENDEEEEIKKQSSPLPKKNKHDESRHRSEKAGKEKNDHERRNHHKESDKSAHTSSSSRDKSKHGQHSKSRTETLEKPHSTEKEKVKSKSATEQEPTDRKRHLNAPDPESNNIKKANVQKSAKKERKTAQNTDAGGNDDGIDSSMGANFADVLGMLNMPLQKSKKSLHNLNNSNNNASSKSGNSKDMTPNKNPNTSVVNGIKTSSSSSSSTRATTSTMRRSPDLKPELLSSSAKLEPLDPSIALELPTISNNYKPLPLNQTVMDCVFNTSTSSSSKVPPRMLTDAEALSHGISSKTMRTKIYSGVKTGQILQVPSLFDLCIRVLQKNIDALEYTGGVPFEVLRSVLERATPQQLLVFEEYNPYLMEDSDVLWKLHVQRNYRTQKRQEMESWREMYLRCQEDQERKLNILAESIKQSQKIIAAPVRKTQLAFVDSLVKPPRNVQRKQEQYGTKGKLTATPAARVAALSSVTPNATKAGDVRLRVAAGVRDAAQAAHAPMRPKKAPLMVKTLQFMRGRHKR